MSCIPECIGNGLCRTMKFNNQILWEDFPRLKFPFLLFNKQERWDQDGTRWSSLQRTVFLPVGGSLISPKPQQRYKLLHKYRRRRYKEVSRHILPAAYGDDGLCLQIIISPGNWISPARAFMLKMIMLPLAVYFIWIL